jgi:hypothetical protein
MPRRSVVAKTTNDSHAHNQLALTHALGTKGWVVLVCPDEEVLTEYRAGMIGILPAGSSFSGRTAMLPGGGRLSVTTATTPVFVPEEVPFTVLFAGWGTTDKKSSSKRMTQWRERAASTLDRMTMLERT